MSTRIDLQLCYILHTRPYRDTSLLVDVLSQEHGKLTLIAKGARKAKSNQRYLLQPFIPVLLSWQGKSALKTLVGIEPALQKTMVSHSTLSSTVSALVGKKLYSGMYVNELLTYLLPQDDPVDQIFDAYQLLLEQLTGDHSEIEPCLRRFEFSFLDELGYGVNVYQDADTGSAIHANTDYVFVQQHGFVVHNSEHSPQAVFSGQALLNIQQGDFTNVLTLQAAKILARTALQPHLKGRQLKSRELFATLYPSRPKK